ncbi:MAG: crosslink repair DNA glycosylase YcaQ family protein [Thermoanaerobaculia bacterium]
MQLTRRELSDGRGRELFDLPAAPRPAGATAAPVRYLPEYDNLLLAHDDRSRIFAPEHRPRVTLKNLQVRATFFVDGFVAGTWRVESKKPAATLVVEPFKVLKREAKRREFRVDPAAHSID